MFINWSYTVNQKDRKLTNRAFLSKPERYSDYTLILASTFKYVSNY